MIRRIDKKDRIDLFEYISDHKELKGYLEKYWKHYPNQAPENILLNNVLQKNHICYVSEIANSFDGILLVYKGNINSFKILGDSKRVIQNLLRVYFWNHRLKLQTHIEINNKIGFILKKYHFRIVKKLNDGFIMEYIPEQKGKQYGRRNNRKFNNTNKSFNSRPTKN